MRLVEDHVHGPRRVVKLGRYTYKYHGLCDEDPDDLRFVYRVARYTDSPTFDGHWVGYYREALGGLRLVAFGHGDAPGFLPMGQIGRDYLCNLCVP
jgi:hypothetical protein